MIWPLKRKTPEPVVFERWEDYRLWAASQGITPVDAYAAWRKAYHIATQGPWNRRRKGVKGSRNKYRDCSTAKEETAT